jgi:hypothetical protein
MNPRYESVTNIFFRVKFIQETINNVSSYFLAELEDGDTPEIIAEKVYGDSGAHWIITMANQIVDPQWDWPLDEDAFRKYLVEKYGSVEYAQTNNHHYEMVVTRTLKPDMVISEARYSVNSNKLTRNMPQAPYNYYFPFILTIVFCDSTDITIDSTMYTVDNGYEAQEGYGLQPGSLATTQFYNTYDIDGKTVVEVIKGEPVTYYDYENQINESKRVIKIIKKDYYSQILKELETLTSTQTSYRRRVS